MKGDSKGSERSLYLAMILSGLFYVGAFGTRPIIPLFLDSLGASKMELGIILSTTSLTALFTSLPLSKLISRLGRWRSITLASFIFSSGLTLALLVQVPRDLYPILILQGIAWALFLPSSLAIPATTSSLERRGRATGGYMMIMGLGMLGGPLICGYITSYIGYRGALAAMALFPILGASILFLGAPRSIFKPTVQVKGSIQRVLRSPYILLIILSFAISSLTDSMFYTIFPIHGREILALSTPIIASFFSLFGFSNTLIRLPSGKIFDRIGGRRAVTIAYILLALAFSSLYLYKDLTSILGIVVFLGLGVGMRNVSSITLIGTKVSLQDTETALALFVTIIALSGFGGSLMAGYIASHASTTTVFLASAILSLGSILLINLERVRI